MRQEIYDKNYSNTSLTIDSDIWTNKDIRGIQKMMMQLYRQMTKDGQQPMNNMTIRQSQILGTSKKDIEWNQEQLSNRGMIEVYRDVVTGDMIEFLYKRQSSSREDIKTSPGLF
jgi:hypothetical protein